MIEIAKRKWHTVKSSSLNWYDDNKEVIYAIGIWLGWSAIMFTAGALIF